MGVHTGILAVSNILGLLLISGSLPMGAHGGGTQIRADGSATISGDECTLTLTATHPGSFQCSLNGGPFETCQTGTTFTGLSPGSNPVDIRFTPNAFSVTLTLQTDCTVTAPTPMPEPPPVRKSVNSSISISGRDATVTLTSNIESTFMCMLDSGRFRRCMSGSRFRNLDCGAHTLKIRCSPVGSDQEFDLRPLQFTVNCATPTPAITLDGSVSVTGDTATITLSASLSGTFECRLDGGRYRPCSSGSMFPGLSMGQHCIRVRFTPAKSSQVIPFDNPICFTPPTPSPTATPTPVTATATVSVSMDTATITLSSTGRGSFRCRVDGGRRTPRCRSGDMFSGLRPGMHTIEVLFTPRGSTDAITIPLEFNVAEMQLVITGRYQIVGDDVQVFFNTTKPATCTCRLNRMRPVPCVSGHVFENVRDGSSSVQIRCRTTTRPRMTESLTLGPFNVTPSPPTQPSPPPPPQVTASGTIAGLCAVRLTFTADITVTYLCRVNGGPWEACCSGQIFSGLPAIRNTIEIMASVVGFPGVRTVVTSNVDLTGQDCPLSLYCPICTPTVIGNNFTFSFQANRPGATYSCSLNDEAPTPCSDQISYTVMRRRRPHKFAVTATEGGDNEIKEVSFRSRYRSGQCQVYTCGEVIVCGTSASIHFTCDDPEATFTCRVNGGSSGECTSPLQLTGLPEGENKVVITPTCGGDDQGQRETITFTV